jgi:molybdopterin converting factor small subunit
MKITVKLFASLRTGRFKQEERTYPIGISCQQVAENLGINTDGVVIVLVNGRSEPLEQVLSDGDVLSFIALVGGG